MITFCAACIAFVAIVFYLLTYQQKKRKNIIVFNVTSKILFIIQYILLGAYEGAMLDFAGAVSATFAQNKNAYFIRKRIKLVFVFVNLFVIAAGLVFYKNFFSLLPVMGVLFQTVALWFDDEKTIRLISVFGSPLWLVYNIYCNAYVSVLAEILTMCSIIIAMVRYDFKKP